jgi:hypothetical protein
VLSWAILSRPKAWSASLGIAKDWTLDESESIGLIPCPVGVALSVDALSPPESNESAGGVWGKRSSGGT